MASLIILALVAITFVYLLLRLAIHFTQDAKEPPVILTGVPFIGPLLGLMRERPRFFLRLRDEYNLPIYTLRLPLLRMYVVNATELIPELQKRWQHVSFGAITAGVGRPIGLTKGAMDMMNRDPDKEEGFILSWPVHAMQAMSPGLELDALNRRAIEIFAAATEELQERGPAKIGLWQWTKKIMTDATAEAVWGPQNPYGDVAVSKAWDSFETGFATLVLFPMANTLFPHIVRARELVASAMMKYMRNNGYEKASSMVRRRFDHHRNLFGMRLDDMARSELGMTLAVLGNLTPCALWLLWHIYSDERVLGDVRREVDALVQEDKERGVDTVDLAKVNTACPILQSTFQEVLRHRAVNYGPRWVLEDVLLDNGRILLKKDSILMIPAPVQHTSVAAWGEDAACFDHLRFLPHKGGSGDGRRKKYNRAAFRTFGGGHVLCPGRHFATTEIMTLAALMVLRFDLVPASGRWEEPTCDNSPVQASFPVPDVDTDVEVRPRNLGRRLEVSFSGSKEAVRMLSEMEE